MRPLAHNERILILSIKYFDNSVTNRRLISITILFYLEIIQDERQPR